MWFSSTFSGASAGLIFAGAGLAAGFPIMLGVVGQLYKDLSGTAFSLVFVVALAGNMIINYGMGLIAQRYGVGHLITLGFVELLLMAILCSAILKRTKLQNT